MYLLLVLLRKHVGRGTMVHNNHAILKYPGLNPSCPNPARRLYVLIQDILNQGDPCLNDWIHLFVSLFIRNMGNVLRRIRRAHLHAQRVYGTLYRF